MTDLTPVPHNIPLGRADRRALFDTLAGRYEEFTALWGRIDTRFSDWFRAALPESGERAADLGCGTGRWSVVLADRYPKVTAADVSNGMLDYARDLRSRPNIDYRQQDALSFARTCGETFDVVACLLGPHHFGDPGVALRAVKSLVAPGGTLIVADMINDGEWEQRGFHIGRAFNDARSAYDLTGDPAAAVTVLDLLLDPTWLDMVTADIPLSLPEFRRTYAEIFPGVQITTGLHPRMAGAVWRNPGDLPRLASRPQPQPDPQPDAQP